ncbi:MAG: M12 family metallo-peptidase [Phycisphaerales bacterium]
MARHRSHALIAPLCLVLSIASPALAAGPEASSPQAAGLAERLNLAAMRTLAIGQTKEIHNLVLPTGASVDLELERVNVLAPNAQVVVGDVDGEHPLDLSDVVILSGHVANNADSIAYVALSPYATNGYIQLDGGTYVISSGAYAPGKDPAQAIAIADMADVVDPAADPVDFCAFDPANPQLSPFGPMIEPAPGQRGVSQCRIAGIAIETDWEFTQRLFGGNASAAAAYAVSLLGAISEIYERDVDVRLSVSFLRVWASNSDPYDPSAGDPLDLVRNEWRSSMNGVQRQIVHYLTGRTDTGYGGVAYLSVMCNTQWGYGVSAHLNGTFPYPLTDHHAGNWDLVVAAHEMGHNFGTGHTHDSYNPVIDGCGNGDCSMAFGGTIMSYCHTCSGGMTNIVLQFHPRVQDTIVAYLDSIEGDGCDLTAAGSTAVPDSVNAYEGASVDLDVLANDYSQSCDPISIAGFDATSGAGGTVTLLAGAGPGGRDMLRYTAPPAYSGFDSFSYQLNTGPSTNVGIDVAPLRDPDPRVNPLPGLAIDYYALSSPSALPDFDALTPYDSDVVMSVNNASTNGNFITSGRADEVGAVLTGYVQAVSDGLYTFYTHSDDGSRLFIGDTPVVNNDGLHGMEERSGQIALHAGWHKIRIEFFENGGGAGLIASIKGPTLSKTPLISIFLSHDEGVPACSPADLAEPFGVLDFSDVSAFLVAFAAQEPEADLAPPNGSYDFSDVLAYLAAFGAGCP